MIFGITRDNDNHRGQEKTLYKRKIDNKTVKIIAVGLSCFPLKTY